MCLAITDHHDIALALDLAGEFPGRVIVGEEIRTTDGEIVGLYLEKKIEAGLSIAQALEKIRDQGGLVYVPHPWEKTRSGVAREVLSNIVRDIDIIEVFNARTRESWVRARVESFAREHDIACASSSDAHGERGVGSAYSVIEGLPVRETLVRQLKEGELVRSPAPLFSLLDPFKNKIKKLLA